MLPANCLDFLPSPMMIRAASSKDLLLVSPDLSCTDDLYICNPITKQFAQLPAIPRPRISVVVSREYALVAMPPSGATTDSRFKVVELLRYFEYPTDLNPEPNPVLLVSLFCSVSRKWEIINFPCLEPSDMWCNSISSDIITCNGILYWLGTPYNSERLVYLDLSKEKKCGAIDVPFGDKSFGHRIGIVHAGGGVHELRLIQVLPMDEPEIIHLRVWRLNTNNNRNDDSNWFLVHDKKLKWLKNVSEHQPVWGPPFLGPLLHPTNGDFLFVVWGGIVIEYNLTDATHKKIAELPEMYY